MEHWNIFAPVLSPSHNETDYQQKIVWLEELMDIVQDDETHPLMSLIDNLATLIEAYEAEHYPIPKAPPADVLRYLMEAQNLKQTDLPELGSQGVVS
jgi:HTH-type transcriptional regulator/antitoxin HigA